MSTREGRLFVIRNIEIDKNNMGNQIGCWRKKGVEQIGFGQTNTKIVLPNNYQLRIWFCQPHTVLYCVGYQKIVSIQHTVQILLKIGMHNETVYSWTEYIYG